MKAFLTVFSFGLFILLSCAKDNPTPNNQSGTYVLDVSNIQFTEGPTPSTGTLIISHNAIAVFPIDLSAKNRVLTVMGPETINETQDKLTCDGNGRTQLDNSHQIVRNINSDSPPAKKDVATITSLVIQMPYKAKQDQFKRIPDNVCVGFRIRDRGWVWHFTAINPVLDEVAQKGFAKIMIEEANVDAVGILFESTTNVEKITYQVQ